MIDFTTKINAQRPYQSANKSQQQSAVDIRYLQRQLESDRGRIITSAATRRLQQKTQVFPLERNAAVRSRLTHSLEVQQNGRYIVKTLFEKLKGKGLDYGLLGMETAVESLIEMACLMHDIGNPPFGHFGEGAIIGWYQKHTHTIFDKAFSEQQYIDVTLKEQMIRDLHSFEGNAQAIRLTYSLQRMNLTYVQSACILKYTRPAWEPRPSSDAQDRYLKKKPGYYLSEQSFLDKMQQALNMQPGSRHPLTYIMEAADDIAYCLADIEDAVDKDILSIARLKELLEKTFKRIGGDPEAPSFKDIQQNQRSFKNIVDYAYQRSEKESINKAHEFFVWLRVGLIHNLVNHAADRFIDNIEAVYAGQFNGALLEDNSPAHSVVETFKQIGFNHVFNHSEVQTLEIQGYQIITGLLDYYKCLLEMPLAAFESILPPSHKTPYLLESRLLNRLGNKYIKAYQEAVAEKTETDPNNHLLWELYYRHRLLQDHISGMNDQFAHDEYKLLRVD
ncbi:dGTPase [Marinicella sp. W31]|uniref:dGTPase n=1 Tax=Marinicella sp. W31 TaxID=3023713 RepID=UPI0037568D36